MNDRPRGAGARTAFVVPTWNGRERIGRALESIAAQSDGDHEIVVVDNGSTDGTADHVAEAFPAVELIREPENTGFAAAVNRGIAAGTSELVALVNDDAELREDWLERAATTLLARHELGSVATKLLDGRRAGRLDGAGDVLGWDGYAARRGLGQADDGSFDQPGPVLGACAAAALYRRAAFEAVGPLDERYFAYLEDVEWSLRAQLGGWRCHYEPTAVAIHSPGSASGPIRGFELYHAHRNMIWLIARWFPLRMIVAASPLIAARRLASLVKAMIRGGAGSVLRGWRDGLAELPRVVRERRAAPDRPRWTAWRSVRPLLKVWAR